MKKKYTQENRKIRGELAQKIADKIWSCKQCGSKNNGITKVCFKCGEKTNSSKKMRGLGRLVIIFLITFTIAFIIIFNSGIDIQ